MNNRDPKALSRRDALKLLGAGAGAAVLANLPSKWSTPALTAGVLPAHAQSSAPVPTHTLLCTGFAFDSGTGGIEVTSDVTIFPASGGISMHYSIILVGDYAFVVPMPAEGDTPTNGSGVASLAFLVTGTSGGLNIVWSFTNPADGTGTCAAGST